MADLSYYKIRIVGCMTPLIEEYGYQKAIDIFSSTIQDLNDKQYETVQKVLGIKKLDKKAFMTYVKSIKNQDILKGVRVKKILGAGNQGIVMLCDVDGKEMALKLMAGNMAGTTLKILTEIEGICKDSFICIEKLPKIIRGKGDLEYIYKFKDKSGSMYFMESIKGDTLGNFIQKGGKIHPVQDCLQLARKLQKLYKLGIVHQDIKVANLMIQALSPDQNVIQIIDFDFATKAQKSAKGIGTPYNVSPEITLVQAFRLNENMRVYAYENMKKGYLDMKSLNKSIDDILPSTNSTRREMIGIDRDILTNRDGITDIIKNRYKSLDPESPSYYEKMEQIKNNVIKEEFGTRDPVVYTHKADIWALGMVFFEMVHGYHIWDKIIKDSYRGKEIGFYSGMIDNILILWDKTYKQQFVRTDDPMDKIINMMLSQMTNDRPDINQVIEAIENLNLSENSSSKDPTMELENSLSEARKNLQAIEDSYEDIRKDKGVISRRIRTLQIQAEEGEESKDIRDELRSLRAKKEQLADLAQPYEDKVTQLMVMIQGIERKILVYQIAKKKIKEDSKFVGEISKKMDDYYLSIYATSGNLYKLLGDKPVMYANIRLMKTDLHIGYFNSVNSYGKELDMITTDNDKEVLKRIGYYGLCYLLNYMKDILDVSELRVSLEASGHTSTTSDMSGLVKYYETMGFIVDDQANFEKDLRHRLVKMSAPFKDISNICYEKTKFGIKGIPIKIIS